MIFATRPHCLIRPLIACLALLTAPVWAASAPSDTPLDYRYQIKLKSAGQQGVVSLRLPKDVYLNARSASWSLPERK